MKPTLEKLLYITLLILFLGGAVMFGILFSQNRKLDRELSALNQIQQNQSKAVTQLNNSTNTVICMLKIPVQLRTTDQQSSCRKQVETPVSQSQPKSSTVQPLHTSATPTPAGKSLAGRLLKVLGL